MNAIRGHLLPEKDGQQIIYVHAKTSTALGLARTLQQGAAKRGFREASWCSLKCWPEQRQEVSIDVTRSPTRFKQKFEHDYNSEDHTSGSTISTPPEQIAAGGKHESCLPSTIAAASDAAVTLIPRWTFPTSMDCHNVSRGTLSTETKKLRTRVRRHK